MITIELPGGVVKIYTDISQLPADNYKEFQKYQLMDSGLGSDMTSVDARFAALFKHAARGAAEDVLREAENLYYTHYFILKGVNLEHLSFGCLIHSVDNEAISDYSEDNLRLILSKVSAMGLTQAILEEHLSSTKKNSGPN